LRFEPAFAGKRPDKDNNMASPAKAGISAAVLRVLCAAAIIACGIGIGHATAVSPSTTSAALWNQSQLGTIDPKVFDLAAGATDCAVRSRAVTNPATMTVIDYSKPSTTPRLWVYDLNNRSLLFQELVAHGSGSGDNTPTRFSNEPDTHASSIGLFVTQSTFVGKEGLALRLIGLDAGFNDHALERGIVMHAAWYVSEAIAAAQGRLGKSWGCPALRPAIARQVIDRIKNGTVVFAYYPDQKWLSTSKYLNGCPSAIRPS